MTTIRVGFDASLYSNSPEQFSSLAPADLASQAQERQPRHPEAIIATPFAYSVDFNNGQVTSLDSQRFISDHLDWSNSLRRQASLATLRISELLLDPANYNAEGIFAYVWISSPVPDVYPESRLVVGVSRYDPDTATSQVSNYGGLYVDLAPPDCIELANHLSSDIHFTSTTQVRQTPIPLHIPKNTNPWEYLATLFPPHPRLWQAIASGQIDREYETIKYHAKEIISGISVAHLGLSHYTDAQISLLAENRLEQVVGYAFIAAVFDCDRTFTFSSPTAINGLEYKFVYNCGHCGTSINAYICKGYQCKSCLNVYLARC